MTLSLAGWCEFQLVLLLQLVLNRASVWMPGGPCCYHLLAPLSPCSFGAKFNEGRSVDIWVPLILDPEDMENTHEGTRYERVLGKSKWLPKYKT